MTVDKCPVADPQFGWFSWYVFSISAANETGILRILVLPNLSPHRIFQSSSLNYVFIRSYVALLDLYWIASKHRSTKRISMVLLEQKPRGIIALAEASSSISPQESYAARDAATDYDICLDSSVILVSIIELAGIGLLIDALREVKHSLAKRIKYR